MTTATLSCRLASVFLLSVPKMSQHFWSELYQISTKLDNFWHTHGEDDGIIFGD